MFVHVQNKEACSHGGDTNCIQRFYSVNHSGPTKTDSDTEILISVKFLSINHFQKGRMFYV